MFISEKFSKNLKKPVEISPTDIKVGYLPSLWGQFRAKVGDQNVHATVSLIIKGTRTRDLIWLKVVTLERY